MTVNKIVSKVHPQSLLQDAAAPEAGSSTCEPTLLANNYGTIQDFEHAKLTCAAEIQRLSCLLTGSQSSITALMKAAVTMNRITNESQLILMPVIVLTVCMIVCLHLPAYLMMRCFSLCPCDCYAVTCTSLAVSVVMVFQTDHARVILNKIKIMGFP